MKNSIPTYLGNLVDDVGKFLDSKDILKNILQNNDEILSASIWGKCIQKLVENQIILSDINEAYNLAIASTYITTFLEAMEKANIQINNIPIGEPIVFDYRRFDINKIMTDDLVLFYRDFFNRFMENRLKNDINKISFINNYIHNHLKLNFLDLLKNDSLVYKNFIDYYKTEIYGESKKLLLKELYEERIASEFTEIVLNDSLGFTLKELYIQPSFKIHSNSLKVEIGSFEAYNECQEQKLEILVFDVFSNKNSSLIKDNEINTIFIAGYPGQGKSSFCKSLVYKQIKNKILKEDIVLIKLKDISDPSALLRDLEGTIKKHIDYEVDSLKNYIIVLDGLDELYMKSSLTLDDIDRICNELIRKDFKVILTTRHQYIDFGLYREDNCLLLALGELSKDQQIEWINKYSTKYQMLKLTQDVLNEIHDNAHNYKHILELIAQPILLHMLTSINLDILDHELTKTKLYKEFFNRLLERSWEKKQTQLLSFFSKNSYKEFFESVLQDIAISIYQSSEEYIKKEDLLKLDNVKAFNEILKKENTGNHTFENNLRGLMIAFYFKEVKDKKNDNCIDDDYAIEFLHKSLMEYKVAEKIWNHVKKNLKNYSEVNNIIQELRLLFSKKLLSKEVIDNLKEIINAEKKSIKYHYFSVLTKDFDSILVNDFMSKDNNEQSIDSSIFTFFGYWNLIQILNQGKSIININNKNIFSKFLRMSLVYDPSIIDLRYQRLQNMNFEKINLSNANFSNSYFLNSNCKMAIFENAIFENTKFDNTDLSNSIFNNAVIYQSDFGYSDFFGCSFRNASIVKTKLKNAKFNGSNFSNTKLTKNLFNPAQIINAIGLK